MIGQTIAQYRITARLGEGGMGVVYEALDLNLGRPVAIKFRAASSEQTSGTELESEARAASRINHPHVAQIYEYGRTGDGHDFIVMELVRGQTLRQLLEKGPLSPEESVRVARAVAEALDEAHRQGVMHLDIKPGNIAITERGVVKVLDFGLARWLPTERGQVNDSSDATTRTMVREWRGTPAFMSPEQARGQEVDARSDLFSLGAVLYQCLTGRAPFRADNAVATLLEVVSADPPAPSSVDARIPPALDRVVGRLLAKDPAARYRSAAEFLADLDSPEVPATAIAERDRRRRLWIGTAVLALAAVLIVAVWFSWLRGQRPSEEPRPVVVLPFENLSGQADQDAFASGLSEIVCGILGERAQFGRIVWVIPSSDVRRYGLRSVADARRVFRASWVVTGSVQRSAGEYLLSLQLANAEGPRVIGSQLVTLADSAIGTLEPKVRHALASLLGASTEQGGHGAAGAGKNTQAYSKFIEATGYLRRYDRNENPQRAIEALEASLKLEPGYVPALTALSDAYLRLYNLSHDPEHLARADQAARSAEAVQSPPDLEVRMALGRILRATGETDAALKQFEEARTLDPGNVSVLLQMAGAYNSAGKREQAEAIYREAIRLRPSYFPAYSNLGISYLSRGRYSEAESPLSMVVKLAPEYADGYITLGTLYYLTGRLDPALQQFTRAIELRPSATAYSNRCGVFLLKSDLTQAIPDCRKAVELDRGNALNWGNLGEALEAAGQKDECRRAYQEAIAAAQRALEVNPKNAELLARVSVYAARVGDRPHASDFANRALALSKDNVNVLYKTGKAFGLSGNCQKARQLLALALARGYAPEEARRDPDLPRIRNAPIACAVPNP